MKYLLSFLLVLAATLISFCAKADWTALNDQGQTGNPNDTSYTIPSLGGSSGSLKDLSSGGALPVALTITTGGSGTAPAGAGTMGAPSAGTPAYNIFNAYISWTAGSNPGIFVYPGNLINYTFSGLDPNKRYRFTATAVRGGTSAVSGNEYSNRWTRAELVGAVSFTPAHTAHVITSNQYPSALSGSQAAWNAGVNLTGDVIEWDNIVPAFDGTFTVRCSKYTGPTPGNGNAASTQYSYSFQAIRLEEFVVSGPLVQITNPVNNAHIILPANLVISASVSGFTNSVTNVAFFIWPTKLGEVASAPYDYPWTNVVPGNYTLRAVATDSGGLARTSAPVAITVQSNLPPVLAITSPADGAVFTAPADIPIEVAAADTDGQVTNVQFYADGLSIGHSASPPFSFLWSGVSTSSYNLTAVATDDRGSTTVSSPSRVYVILSTAPTVAAFDPVPGTVSNLTSVTVTFTEPVVGVEATDLLINSLPASRVSGANDTYTFWFAPPQEGTVSLTWAPRHGILDREVAPKAFDGTRTNEVAQYTLTDTVPPVAMAASPAPGATLSSLTSVDVTFSEPVTGVDAGDLRINGSSARKVTGSLAGPYHFSFAQPAAGQVQVSWAPNHGIHDFGASPNAFVGTNWSYTLDLSGAETNVLISEIMYHPAPEVPENEQQEWIELHNRGTAAVNLQGWRLTKAVNYAFTNIVLPPNGYLVVAADVATFHARYPNVSNVVGNWSGGLGNNGDEIYLRNASGNLINSVHYGTQDPEWSERIRGNTERQVTSLTRSGNTMTAVVFGHDLDTGDLVRIYGADQPEYNGIFTVSVPSYTSPQASSTFTYTISGNPVSAPTGFIIARRLTWRGWYGWGWSSLADGLGRSLELVNEALPNQCGQNWAPSTQHYGTPGAPNSAAATNSAPLILDVHHSPVVPRSTDSITISARLLAQSAGSLTARVWYRNATGLTPGPWANSALYDDGSHGDGASGDGLWAGQIPPQTNLTIVEFYVEAVDAKGLRRTWPKPALDTNDVPIQAANALFQVDNSTQPTGQPLYRFILTGADADELKRIQASDYSTYDINTLENMTFISTDGVETLCNYLVGVRNRGAGMRNYRVMSYAVQFGNVATWKGERGLNFYSGHTPQYVAGMDFTEMGGIGTELGYPVRIRVNGVDLQDAGATSYGSYIQMSKFDSIFAKELYPQDSGGNIYRGSQGGTPMWGAKLEYLGPDPILYYGQLGKGYYKANNTGVNDWTDLINLCAVLSSADYGTNLYSANRTDDALYAQAVSKVVNVENWMRAIALFNLSGSGETALFTGYGDDYALYRGVQDPRFVLLGHDFDAVFGQDSGSGPAPYNQSLFRMCPVLHTLLPGNSWSGGAYDPTIGRVGPDDCYHGDEQMPVLNRFMTNAYFAPIYYRVYRDLLDTSCSLDKVARSLDQRLASWVPASLITQMKTYYTNRYNFVRSRIPLGLTITNALTRSNGYPYTTSPNVALGGKANAINTRSVAVNGQPAVWTAWLATWTSTTALNPGVNRVLVQSFDADGHECDRQTIDIWYNRGAETTVPAGTLSGNTLWSAASGPYHLTGNLTVPSGTTLTIQPGTTVYFDTGAGITVNGQLLAQGTTGQRIRFTHVPGSSAFWSGFSFNNARQSNVLAYADFEYAGSAAQAISIRNSQVLIDRMTFFNNNPTSKWLDIWQPQVTIRHSVFGDLGATYFCTAENMLADGWFVIDGNLFGKDTGDNDIFHLNRVSVKGGAAAMVVNNVFTGAGDDIVDDNETDTHIEGNLIMHANETSGGNHGASAAVTTGPGGSLGVPNMLNQHLTVVRNVFYKNDYAIISKTGAYSQIYNNVFIGNRGAIMFDETDRSDAGPGRQSYIESCIFWSNKPDDGLTNGVLVDLNDPMAFASGRLSRGQPQVTVNNSILPARFHYLGTNNLDIDPLFVFPTNTFEISPTNAAFSTGFDGFDSSPYLLAGGGIPDVHLQPNSPAIGAGFNGVDMGAYVSPDATISGEPLSPTSQTEVTLTIGGTDLYGYKYRVLGPGFSSNWSDEREQMKPVYQITVAGTTATATVTNHSYANGDWIQVLGADALTPYLNGRFQISGVTSNSFNYAVVPGTNALINQTQPRDLWCKRPEPIRLTSLAAGTYQVEVIRKNSQGLWQNLAVPTVSRSWTVNGTWPNLQINEILARNVTSVLVNGKYPDLVELYNRGSTPLTLEGMSLTDDPATPQKYVFPAGAQLQGGGYLVLHADNETASPGYHLGFGLSQDGEALYLFTASGQLLDSVSFGPQVADLSIGRLSNGQWALCRPAFGQANTPVQLGDPHELRINEWLLSGGNLPSFIELFNPDALPVSLGGLSLSGNWIGAPAQHQIATLSFISGHGYASFLPDGNPGSGPLHLSFTLAPERGEIALSDEALNLIDHVCYGPQSTGVSQGRSPSGSVNLLFFTTPTPDAPNPAPVQPGGQIVINEVLAKNVTTLTNLDGGSPDWIELYNPTASALALADMSLTDDPASPRKWLFPAGTSVPAGGYILVLCDASQPASSNAVALLNCGFNIKANGGSMYLFDKPASGGALLDGISYGIQASDLSIGRVPSGSTNWMLNLPTPNGLNIAAQLGDSSQLRLNEWMAYPASGGKWFEVFNPNAQPVALSGLSLRDDTHVFSIAPLSFIGSGLRGYTRFWADKDTTAGPDHVSFGIKASGNVLGIFQANGTQIDYINFGQQALGVSEGRLPDGSTNIVRFPQTATPGEGNFLPLPNVVINEVLTHTDPPLEDAVELFNASSQDVNIGGWFLSNSQDNPMKYRIPAGTVIPAHGFNVFYEYQFNPTNGSSIPFPFNSAHGDQAYLSEADANGNLTGMRAYAAFGAAANGVSFGRYTNSIGQVDFVAMSARSFGVNNPATLEEFREGTGAPNPSPQVGPVVINEIMFNPPGTNGVDNVLDEYVELLNFTSSAVPLFDPAAATNTWKIKGGIDYTFPQSVTMPARGLLLLVNFDPVADPGTLAEFRSRYGLSPTVPLYGPYGGHLANSGENLELYKPDPVQVAPHPDAGFVPYVLVERVAYSDAAPWPSGASSTGSSLQRLVPANYGNDPANWFVAAPTAGRLSTANPQDTNGDGLPDTWQVQYFGSITDPRARPDADPDGDGFSNLQEYLAGTSPTDPSSYLKLDSVVVSNDQVTIQFKAVAGKTYTLLASPDLNGSWTKLADISAQATDRIVNLTDSGIATSGGRFYRLVTLALP